MSPKYRLALIVGSTILVLDQITKALVENLMHLYQAIEIVPNFVHLTYLKNTGAAFGLLAGTRSTLRIAFFVLVSGVAIGCVLYLLKNLRPERTSLVASFSLILGGAIGNLIDRLRMGEVIDFIDLHWHHFHWPAFNVADSSITIGVILLFIQMIRKQSLNF